jgi:hypothetical protein
LSTTTLFCGEAPTRGTLFCGISSELGLLDDLGGRVVQLLVDRLRNELAEFETTAGAEYCTPVGDDDLDCIHPLGRKR